MVPYDSNIYRILSKKRLCLALRVFLALLTSKVYSEKIQLHLLKGCDNIQ